MLKKLSSVLKISKTESLLLEDPPTLPSLRLALTLPQGQISSNQRWLFLQSSNEIITSLREGEVAKIFDKLDNCRQMATEEIENLTLEMEKAILLIMNNFFFEISQLLNLSEHHSTLEATVNSKNQLVSSIWCEFGILHNWIENILKKTSNIQNKKDRRRYLQKLSNILETSFQNCVDGENSENTSASENEPDEPETQENYKSTKDAISKNLIKRQNIEEKLSEITEGIPAALEPDAFDLNKKNSLQQEAVYDINVDLDEFSNEKASPGSNQQCAIMPILDDITENQKTFILQLVGQKSADLESSGIKTNQKESSSENNKDSFESLDGLAETYSNGTILSEYGTILKSENIYLVEKLSNQETAFAPKLGAEGPPKDNSFNQRGTEVLAITQSESEKCFKGTSSSVESRSSENVDRKHEKVKNLAEKSTIYFENRLFNLNQIKVASENFQIQTNNVSSIEKYTELPTTSTDEDVYSSIRRSFAYSEVSFYLPEAEYINPIEDDLNEPEDYRTVAPENAVDTQASELSKQKYPTLVKNEKPDEKILAKIIQEVVSTPTKEINCPVIQASIENVYNN